MIAFHMVQDNQNAALPMVQNYQKDLQEDIWTLDQDCKKTMANNLVGGYATFWKSQSLEGDAIKGACVGN